jgi:tight adherence protein B
VTGLGVGALLGGGVFLIWWSCWTPRPRHGGRGRSVGVFDVLRDDIVHAGFSGLSVRALLGACVIAAMVVVAVVQVGVGVAPIAGCCGLMGGWLPLAIVRSRARRRRSRLRDRWPEVVDHITSGVRAGMALPEALGQLGHRGPDGLRDPFAAFADDYRLTGRFGDCLDRLKDRLSDPVADRLVESLRIAREVGGPELGRVLRTLSAFLRDDVRTRAELEARQSWTVYAARLAAAAPWIMLGVLAMSPVSIAAYSSGPGALVLAVGAAVTVVAYGAMIRIGRLPEDERVLR